MEQEDLCTICWTLPTTRAGISVCRHTFCLECIEQWSTRENRCPLCKTRFARISWSETDGTSHHKDVQTKNQSNQRGTTFFVSVNMIETQAMRHVLTLGGTPNGFSLRIGVPNLDRSEYRAYAGEDHDVQTCEICFLMRNIDHTRDLRRRRDSDATD